MAMTKEEIKKIVAKQKEVLSKRYGINSEAELDEAIKNMKPLNIGCFTSPVPKEALTNG